MEFGEKYVKLEDTAEVILLEPRAENHQRVIDMYLEHQNRLLGELAVCERTIEWMLNNPPSES